MVPAPAAGQVTPADRAAHHDAHGHAQWHHGHGTPGHTWQTYRSEARQINTYLRVVAANRMRACARDPRCAVRLAAYLARAPYRLADRIVGCESGYNPTAANPTSSAGGLYQYIEGTWSSTAPRYGMAGRSRFETWPAAWVGANHLRDAGPTPWAASRHGWG